MKKAGTALSLLGVAGLAYAMYKIKQSKTGAYQPPVELVAASTFLVGLGIGIMVPDALRA